jgi:hypothetical protein
MVSRLSSRPRGKGAAGEGEKERRREGEKERRREGEKERRREGGNLGCPG